MICCSIIFASIISYVSNFRSPFKFILHFSNVYCLCLLDRWWFVSGSYLPLVASSPSSHLHILVCLIHKSCILKANCDIFSSCICFLFEFSLDSTVSKFNQYVFLLKRLIYIISFININYK